jgi:hypothetical protein
MASNRGHWKGVWADKRLPLYRADTPRHYDEYARELSLLLSEPRPRRILELGRGTG